MDPRRGVLSLLGTKEQEMDILAKTKVESLLEGELSAAETYRRLVDRFKDRPFAETLRENLASHQRRVDVLQARVSQDGGAADANVVAWSGIDADDEVIVFHVLDENEDQLLREYRNRPGMADLDATSLRILGDTLIPEQERTEKSIAKLLA